MNRDFSIIRTHRNLPHWQRDDASAVYWITFRLADSLPQAELERLTKVRNRFLDEHPKPWGDTTWNLYRREFSDRLDEWLDAGHGACILTEPECRKHVIEALLKFDGERHDLISAVIMPNHVHLLLRLRHGIRLGMLLKGIKGSSARNINLTNGSTGQSVWMEESYDHIVRSREELQFLREYVRTNPEKLKPGTFWLEEREIRFKLVSDPLHQVLYAEDE